MLLWCGTSLAKAWTVLAMLLVFPPIMLLFDGASRASTAMPPEILNRILIGQAVTGLLVGASSLASWAHGRLNMFLLISAVLAMCFSVIAAVVASRSIPIHGPIGYLALAALTLVFGVMAFLTLLCYWSQQRGKNHPDY